MKLFLSVLLLLVCLALLLSPCRAAPPSPEARARAALALALVQAPKAKAPEQGDCGCGGLLPCTCGKNCTCGAVKTSEVAARAPVNPIENLAYEIAYQRAIKQSKPLLVWVGETCPSCESSWTQYVHCRCTEYESPSGDYSGPGVIVGKPDTMGGLDRVATLSGIPSLSTVEGVLGRDRVAQTSVSAPVVQPVAPPMFSAPPVLFGGCGPMGCGMPMMGGFGGGGGFCGGGG